MNNLKAHHFYYPFYRRILHWFLPHEKNTYRPHALRHTTLASYGLLLLAVKAGLTLSLFLLYPNEATFSTLTAQRIIELTNQARAEAGIGVLGENTLLDTSASLKAHDMATYGYFAHKSPKSGQAPWEWFKKAGYEYTYAGENLAMDFRSAEDVLTAWMDSPKHRENILNPKYADIGIAVVTGEMNGRTVTLVVQHFGKSYLRSTVASNKQALAVKQAIPQAGEVQGASQQVAPASTVVTFENKKTGFLSLIQSVKTFYALFALIFGALLTLNMILLRRFSHHHSMVYVGIAIMALSVGLIFAQTHFLEQIGGAVVIW